jgi:hypothetical protein
MKRTISILALLTAATIGVVGCGGDDDDSDNTTGGSSNVAGKPASAGGDSSTPSGGDSSTSAGGDGSTPTGGASSGNVMCDPTQDGVCQNPMDCPFVADGTARMTAGSCGQGCLGKAANCSRDCILEMLDMSSECATCYADTVNCTIMNCLAQCIGDPEADACKQCQIDQGCRAAFDDCSGLPG